MTVPEPAYDVISRTRIRRATAKRMRASMRDKPSVTLHRTVDARPMFAHLKALRKIHGDVNAYPTLTSVLAVVLARVLRGDPIMNSCVEGDDGQVRRYREVHLAVAIETTEGLVPPVLRPDDLVDDQAAASALARLILRARSGSLNPGDFVPSTFTLTNLGSMNIHYFTPILNPPHVGILGVGRSPEHQRDGLPLSLTFDHAALDGMDGARFIESLSEEIIILEAS